MGEATKIEWCDHTFNPWRGCTKVSAGCANCYAEAMSRRNPAVLGEWGDGGNRVIAAESSWKQPLAWDRAAAKAGGRRRVFCGSLCDVFEARPDVLDARLRLFGLIHRTPNLDWLLLTKRPEYAHGWLTRHYMPGAICDWHAKRGEYLGELPWPLPNVWIGTSVEDQAAADARIPHMLKIPARVRFLSCEPLLGAVDLTQHLLAPVATGHRWCDTAAWVIVGGESGPNARPCDVGWVRSIVRQCKAAGVACFVKQLGARPYMAGSGLERHSWPCGWTVTNGNTWLNLLDGKGGEPEEWPSDLRVREFPA